MPAHVTPLAAGHYRLASAYGPPLDGDRESAGRQLAKGADKVCPDGYEIKSDMDVPRLTIWGAENGQGDRVWEITCR